MRGIVREQAFDTVDTAVLHRRREKDAGQRVYVGKRETELEKTRRTQVNGAKTGEARTSARKHARRIIESQPREGLCDRVRTVSLKGSKNLHLRRAL